MSGMNTKTFKVGDRVKWKSHSQGIWKEKEGAVSQIVKAGDVPNEILRCGSLPRNHESYVVAVPSERGNPKLYWPRVSALELA